MLKPHLPMRDDGGFTLVELLVAIVIMAIIAVPLGDVIISYLHNTDATTGRLSESHDAQISATYFHADVASLGVRSTTYSSDPSKPYPFTQSIEENAPATGGLFPCGTAATPSAVIRFGWDDYTDAAASAPTRMRVAYVADADASGELQLHRLVCAGSATVLTDTVIAHDLVSVAANCVSPAACEGSAPPLIVELKLTVHDPQSAGAAPYEITLTGQRRQS
ncbi:PulJ/GspJ family protein [Jatrophihabitans sp.]|jgi:prepilin-type N-terminal cleavage/methylation domain-containing protein|uniref:PulJ/GspJ family protein n=1 Tax=Jatrophihabitans sp. TaxID=1932789 RepID=UPI002EF3585D